MWLVERGNYEPVVPSRAPWWLVALGMVCVVAGWLALVSASRWEFTVEGRVGAGLILVGVALLARFREAWLVARGLTYTAFLALLGHLFARLRGIVVLAEVDGSAYRWFGLLGGVVLALVCLLTWLRLRSSTAAEAFGWRGKVPAPRHDALVVVRKRAVVLRALAAVTIIVLVTQDSRSREPWRTVVPLNPGMLVPAPVGKPRRSTSRRRS